MSSLSNEETKLVSNDGSVILTTHRVIHKDKNFNKQLMLSEFVSYEIIRRRSTYYKKLSVILVIIALGLGFWAIMLDQQRDSLIDRIRYGGSELDQKFELLTSLLGLVTFMLVISLILLVTSTKKFLKIIGRFNDIQFPINRLSQSSQDSFIENLLRQSEYRRKE